MAAIPQNTPAPLKKPALSPVDVIGKAVMYAVLAMWFVMVVFPMLW